MGLLKPEVYEVAAELIAEKKHGFSFSCDAIGHAVAMVYKKESANRRWFRRRDHIEKYQRYFAPRRANGQMVTSWFANDPEAEKVIDKHPYWNKDDTAYRRNNRVQALLMMAEILRSEPNPSIKR